jgi:hypothetical protein
LKSIGTRFCVAFVWNALPFLDCEMTRLGAGWVRLAGSTWLTLRLCVWNAISDNCSVTVGVPPAAPWS